MPSRRIMPLDEFALFMKLYASKLTVTPEAVRERVERGAALEIETSAFADPGEDYVNILLDGRVIAHVPGY